MGVEIERKFLVVADCWRENAGPGRHVCQGYLARDASTSIRVRRKADRAFLTVKGERMGIARQSLNTRFPSLKPRRCY